jgi:hypothetical protein
MPLRRAVAIEGVVVNSVEWEMTEEGLHLLQRGRLAVDRSFAGVIDHVLLDRLCESTGWSLTIDQDFPQFVQSTEEIPFCFFEVRGAGTFA